ncbi:MAG: LamG domain-containing protein [Flavobacteriales bacterium]|nr:LamG domain-containing protein [Flavobacteriales bacterium]
MESYYQCDEVSGVIVDAHGSDHSVNAYNIGYGAAGVYNTAIDFEAGSQSHVDFGNAKDFSAYAGVTIGMWINLESQPTGTAGTDPSYRHLYYNGSGSGSQIYLRYQIISGVYYIYWGTYRAAPYAESYTRYAVTLTLGTWYHICGVHNGSNSWDLYIDGSLVSTAVSSGDILTGAGKDVIGARWGGSSFGRWHDGLVDEVAIYSRALSSPDIGNLITLPYSNFTV